MRSEEERMQAWREEDQIIRFQDCPKCGGVGTIVVSPWWDDLPENGGECIGEIHACVAPKCDYCESF
jgi:hypothetical protein